MRILRLEYELPVPSYRLLLALSTSRYRKANNTALQYRKSQLLAELIAIELEGDRRKKAYQNLIERIKP